MVLGATGVAAAGWAETARPCPFQEQVAALPPWIVSACPVFNYNEVERKQAICCWRRVCEVFVWLFPESAYSLVMPEWATHQVHQAFVRRRFCARQSGGLNQKLDEG